MIRALWSISYVITLLSLVVDDKRLLYTSVLSAFVVIALNLFTNEFEKIMKFEPSAQTLLFILIAVLFLLKLVTSIELSQIVSKVMGLILHIVILWQIFKKRKLQKSSSSR